MISATPTTLHVAPRRGWLNDPNGVVHHNDRWHVFFQHNPARAVHGNIHWGHVSSPDLVTWTEQPVAFGPQPGGPDRGGCWSGVFLVGAKAPAVAYSGVGDGPTDTTVCVRYALDDDLLQWSDPVVVAEQPQGIGLLEMRDPFLFWWGGRRYAILGAGLTNQRPAILLYSCEDLEAWRFERVWIAADDPVLRDVAPAEIWECPQLVQVDGSWVLMLSLWIAGLTERVVHAVGSMTTGADGLPGLALRDGAPTDLGPVFYAPQVVPDPAGPLLFGWVRDDPAPEEDHRHASSGCLTLPRRLSLYGDLLVQRVDPAVSLLRGAAALLTRGSALPRRCVVTVEGETDGAATKVTLSGSHGPIEVPGVAPLELWVEGDVVEVFTADGAATTLRQSGTAEWTLLVDEGTAWWHDLRLPEERPDAARVSLAAAPSSGAQHG